MLLLWGDAVFERVTPILVPLVGWAFLYDIKIQNERKGVESDSPRPRGVFHFGGKLEEFATENCVLLRSYT